MAKEKEQAKEEAASASASLGNTEIVSKVSVKTLIGKIKKPKEDDKPRALVHIYGIVRGTKEQDTDYGVSTAFFGDFEGVNLETRERARGGKLFLPNSAAQLLKSAFEAAIKPDDDGAIPLNGSVQFALEIGIKYSEKSVGYEYVVKPLIQTTDNDPLAQLRGNVSKMLPALAAPAKG